MATHRIFTTPFAGVYPHYVAKAEKKDRTREEVDAIIGWLTGFSAGELARHLKLKTDFEQFFTAAPCLHPNAHKITGVVCGVRVEALEDPLMQNIRRLGKLVDELAKSLPLKKILRS